MSDFDGVINPPADWAPVPQLSATAVALGGPGGCMNAQAVALTQRSNAMLRMHFKRIALDLGLNLVAGSFEEGATLDSVDDAIIHYGGQQLCVWSGTLPKNVPTNSTPAITGGFAANAWVDKTSKTLREILCGNWAQDPYMSLDITDAPLSPVGGGDNRVKWQRSRASLRAGLRDSHPLDDTLNFFRGLPNKDSWSAPEMQGIGSVSFGRNGASFGYLSATFGHDCVAYGAAGLAGGAGSCAGNPDLPLQDAAFGYCSFAYGKMTIAMGRAANAMGQECQANTLVSSADGYASIAGPGLASHPNARFPGATDKGVVSEGRAARAHGWKAQAYGDFSVAMGSYVRAYNGCMVVGSGPDENHPLIGSVNGAQYFGAQCTMPAMALVPDDGTYDKAGMNTHDPRERFEVVLKAGDKVVYRTVGASGNGTFALQGTLSNGDSVDILTVDWNSPSGTDANGVVVVKINGITAFTINSNGAVDFGSSIGLGGSLFVAGNKVVGAQQPKIVDSLTDAQKINAMIAAMRNHGLINPSAT